MLPVAVIVPVTDRLPGGVDGDLLVVADAQRQPRGRHVGPLQGALHEGRHVVAQLVELLREIEQVRARGRRVVAAGVQVGRRHVARWPGHA
jgi:hypothetical protein